MLFQRCLITVVVHPREIVYYSNIFNMERILLSETKPNHKLVAVHMKCWVFLRGLETGPRQRGPGCTVEIYFV